MSRDGGEKDLCTRREGFGPKGARPCGLVELDVPYCRVGVGDLNDVYLRFDLAVSGHEEPPFFEDAALAVSRDFALIDHGIGTAFRKRSSV